MYLVSQNNYCFEIVYEALYIFPKKEIYTLREKDSLQGCLSREIPVRVDGNLAFPAIIPDSYTSFIQCKRRHFLGFQILVGVPDSNRCTNNCSFLLQIYSKVLSISIAIIKWDTIHRMGD